MNEALYKQIDELLYHYVVQRDMYYSELKDGVITDKEWAEIRNKIQAKARTQIKALINSQVIEARIDELKKLRKRAEMGYMDTWGRVYSEIDERINQLKGGK